MSDAELAGLSPKSDGENLSVAKSLKEDGNRSYAQKKFREAIRQYHKALLYVKAIERDERGLPFNMATLGGNSAEKVSKEIAAENQKLKIDCYNNLSACLLKMPEPNYEKIVSYCDQVIEADSENSKAHFRRAQALTKLGIYEEAVKSCIEAKKYSPFPDSGVANLITVCNSNLTKQHEKQKMMYSNMLGFK